MAENETVPPAPEDMDLPSNPVAAQAPATAEASPPANPKKENVYVLMPGEDEIFVDGILLRKRVNATLELQDFAVTKVKELMQSEIAKDPDLAINFLRAATDGAVKMVDSARKFAEGLAKNESYFGKLRAERLRLFSGRQIPEDGEHTISDSPAPEAEVAETPPTPVPEEVPAPIVEPADLGDSQFGDLRDLP